MCASPEPDDDPNKEKARRLRVALEDKAAELERMMSGVADAEDGEEESLCVSDAGEAHLEDAASDRAPRGGDRET